VPDKKSRGVSNLANKIPDVPDAPTVSAVNVGTARAYNNGAATVTISSPTGGLPSSYSITTTPSTVTTTATTSPVTLTGLSSATSYTVTVTPSNVSATGSATTTSSFTATTVPQAPTIGTVTDLGTGGSATIAFTAGATGGSSVTTYTATSSPGSITGTSSSSPITVTGLTDGTAYTFTVTATNANGVSTSSSASGSVTTTGPAFESIQTVTVGSGGQSTITFSSIPSTYKHLQLRATVFNKDTSGDVTYSITPAGTTPTTSYNHYLRGDGTSVASGSKATIRFITDNGNAHTIRPLVFVMDILDYADTNKNKTVKILRGIDPSASAIQADVGINSSFVATTSALTGISFGIYSTGFAQYSSFALYGIKG